MENVLTVYFLVKKTAYKTLQNDLIFKNICVYSENNFRKINIDILKGYLDGAIVSNYYFLFCVTYQYFLFSTMQMNISMIWKQQKIII